MSATSSEQTYVVEGMTCEHCELSVKEEVEQLSGVASADADRTTGRLVVRGGNVDDGAVRRAVEGAGYKIASSSPGS